MIFQKTIDNVLNGTKTQTRRIVKADQRFDNQMLVVYRSEKDYERAVYAVGSTYAAQRGRGVKAEARIRITGIRREDVRNISEADVKAEGFAHAIDFWDVWGQLHDPQMQKDQQAIWDSGCAFDIGGWMKRRPDERYTAWVIEFQLETV